MLDRASTFSDPEIIEFLMEASEGRITGFELVASGDFWGGGRYTRRAPEGKFPLAVLFTLADGSDIADRIPPQGSRGWVEGYLGARQ